MKSIKIKDSVFVLSGLSILIWVWCIRFHMFVKTSLLDDTFIYMHIVNNVLEAGTAKFFPIADSPALLASSPLHFLVLLPAALIARLASDPDRSFQAVRLTLVFYGFFSSLLYLPFFRRNLVRWLIGLAFAGLICLSTETGLQMEGILLFWGVYTLAFILTTPEKGVSYFRKLGLLAGMLMLTRPEYGLFALVFLLVYALTQREKSHILAYVTTVAGIGVGWILIAALLGVYPIPTTYVSKVMTGEVRIFQGGTFLEVIPERIGGVFFFGNKVGTWLILATAAVAAVAVALSGKAYKWFVAAILLVFVILQNAPGNYLWYFENFFVVIVSACFCAVLSLVTAKRTWRIYVLAVVVAIPMLSFFGRSLGRNRPMFWNFRETPSRATAYTAIGLHYWKAGLFRFSELEPCYLVTNEVGIIAYYAGLQAWLFDNSGLAQPGVFEHIRSHRLARMYPRSVFSSAQGELDSIRAKFGHTSHPYDAYLVHGNPDPIHAGSICELYDPRLGVCLENLEHASKRSVKLE
jgi:hypothetical protein